ncbi:MAG TPA: hypothetical protein VGW97_04445, partial [Chthoniobacterales bacterium]|nr:hypothetical protein [Chthoniobacterales bacterium]
SVPLARCRGADHYGAQEHEGETKPQSKIGQALTGASLGRFLRSPHEEGRVPTASIHMPSQKRR